LIPEVLQTDVLFRMHVYILSSSVPFDKATLCSGGEAFFWLHLFSATSAPFVQTDTNFLPLPWLSTWEIASEAVLSTSNESKIFFNVLVPASACQQESALEESQRFA